MSDYIDRQAVIDALPLVTDGFIGERTFYSLIMSVKGANVPPQPIRPKMSKRKSAFICACCGGNDTEEKNGKVYCAYCGTLLETTGGLTPLNAEEGNIEGIVWETR